MESITSLDDRKIAPKLRDRKYRTAFFSRQSKDEVVRNIRGLRKARGLSKSALAKVTGMKASAVSRLESDDYAGWSFPTLLRIAEALDAKVRITFDLAEDAVRDFERKENESVYVAAVNSGTRTTATAHGTTHEHLSGVAYSPAREFFPVGIGKLSKSWVPRGLSWNMGAVPPQKQLQFLPFPAMLDDLSTGQATPPVAGTSLVPAFPLNTLQEGPLLEQKTNG
jgi:transcriptional regulator with XRE-family HTH domain